jgi:hypothetical protein
MANPLKDTEFENLFTAGEQPGSQASYWVERELQRRRELAQRVVDAKMIEAADAQIAAASHAERAAEAAIDSATAAKTTAVWTRISTIAVALTVIIMAIGTWIDAVKP